MFTLVRDKQTGQWYNPDHKFDELVNDNTRHGGAYDRGSADSYYGRPFAPHYFKGDTYNSERIELLDPSTATYKAYKQGYDDNQASGNYKDWG